MNMHRSTSHLSLIFASLVTVMPLAAQAQTTNAAPADEYFGSYRMSVLGIRNVLHDIDVKIQNEPANATRYLAMLSLTENAIVDWEHKYPSDTWLARSWYGLQHLYAKVHSDECSRKALEMATRLVTKYPNSSYAKTMRDELEAAFGPMAIPPAADAPESGRS